VSNCLLEDLRDKSTRQLAESNTDLVSLDLKYLISEKKRTINKNNTRRTIFIRRKEGGGIRRVGTRI